MAKFEYQGRGRTAEDVTRYSRQSGSAYDSFLVEGAPFFKLREGTSTLRILPGSWKDIQKWDRGWHIPIYMHFSVGVGESSYLCPNMMLKQDCPICEAKLRATDRDEQFNLTPGFRALCYVIDRERENEGPMIWSMPKKVFLDINGRTKVNKNNDEIIYIDDPDHGYDITIKREGTDKKSQYSGIDIDRKESYLHENEKKQDAWLDYISDNPLPDMLQYYDYEHIKDVLMGGAEASEGRGERRSSRREEPAEEPRGRSSRRDEPAEEERASSRSERGSRRDADNDDPPPRGRERERGGDREEARTESRSARDREDPPFDPDDAPPSRSARSNGRDREEPKEEPRSERRRMTSDTPTEQAKSSLDRLRERSR